MRVDILRFIWGLRIHLFDMAAQTVPRNGQNQEVSVWGTLTKPHQKSGEVPLQKPWLIVRTKWNSYVAFKRIWKKNYARWKSIIAVEISASTVECKAIQTWRAPPHTRHYILIIKNKRNSNKNIQLIRLQNVRYSGLHSDNASFEDGYRLGDGKMYVNRKPLTNV